MLPLSPSENKREQTSGLRKTASQGLVCLSLVDDFVFFLYVPPLCSGISRPFRKLLPHTWEKIKRAPKARSYARSKTQIENEKRRFSSRKKCIAFLKIQESFFF